MNANDVDWGDMSSDFWSNLISNEFDFAKMDPKYDWHSFEGWADYVAMYYCAAI